MRISIAMCTYNGDAFLAEQLASFAAQSRLPDELCVRDDGSTDRTQEIVQSFAKKAPFAVRLVVNERNLGSTANFDRAIKDCSGDVIALSDQDDVWLPTKLARFDEEFARDPSLTLVNSDARLVDERLGDLALRLWTTLFFDAEAQRTVQKGRGLHLLVQRGNVVTGACAAFRVQPVAGMLHPIPASWVHDGWIAAIAAAVGRWKLITEPLVLYRQHARQQIGAKKLGVADLIRIAKQLDKAKCLKQAGYYEDLRVRLAQFRDRVTHPEVIGLLEKKVAHLHARAAMRDLSHPRRIPAIVREAFRLNYIRFGFGPLGYGAIASDLFF